MLRELMPLIGTWAGEGLASYPTMEDVPYREELRFRFNDGATYLQVEQKTWRLDGGAQSHREFGFIRPREDGSWEWVNAQSGGRVEVLVGRIHVAADTVRLAFTSAQFGNDPRMLEATRELTLEGDALCYELLMALQSTPTLTRHLAATLTRKTR